MHEYFMEIALNLAELGRGYTSPNPLVGAVIVKDGRIIGSGYHQKYGDWHAEIHALNSVRESLEDATMYVTLEPCSHHGKTPPCCEAVVKSGIKKVVVATIDPNPLVSGRGIEYLRNHGVEVITDVLGQRSVRMNEIFNKYVTNKKPFVLVKAAMTLDGKIATVKLDSKWISSDKSRMRVQQLRKQFRSILVGVGTVIADDPSLTCRLDEDVIQPLRIIVDTHGRIPLHSRVLNDEFCGNTLIVMKDSVDHDLRLRIEEKGVKTLLLKLHEGKIDLHYLMEQLGEMGIDSVLIEGGSEIIASSLSANIVDKVMFFIAPKIIGGRLAKSVVGGDGVDLMKDALVIDELACEMVGGDMVATGYIKGGHR
ncbi:MAG: bifunctional diaminohydroxyphosphoribosylaminopyrimidine deaminase/5-amino-6-(5-phosphoribosylamino)uracil reductase RibD [Erysipelotrichaceae bacterium]|nr:bifunctional diaminohydroxyphosphoribosylaminopyrimidine deaminase/5-amino-6-(5-phosphoribosylamino)uracil reductase RibD [Erysipelotrichaceae bacterium]